MAHQSNSNVLDIGQARSGAPSGRPRRPQLDSAGRTPSFNRTLKRTLQTTTESSSRQAQEPLWSNLTRWMPGATESTAPNCVTPITKPSPMQSLVSMIRGFDQTNPAEYDSASQARTWGYSTCSAASLTAVLRGAGIKARIADVMRAMPTGLSPALGLVSRPALVAAAARFGAQATDDVRGYASLQGAAVDGQPVLVDVRNNRFPEGHWMVVTGADENGVSLADSSRYNLTYMPKDQFLSCWSGRGIRVEDVPAADLPEPA